MDVMHSQQCFIFQVLTIQGYKATSSHHSGSETIHSARTQPFKRKKETVLNLAPIIIFLRFALKGKGTWTAYSA